MSVGVSTVGISSTGNASSVRWKLFLLMLLLYAVNYIDRASLSIAMPLMSKEFDLDPALQGLILSAFFWTYTAVQVPGGILVDRYKPRIVITVATVGWGVFQALAAITTNSWGLLLTRLGLGAFEAPIGPACGKLNAIWMPQNERGRGAVLFNSGAALGAALGAIIVAWLITSLGSWRAAFLVAGVGTVLCGWWSWYYLRNSPRQHPSVNEAEARHIEQGHALEDAAAPTTARGNWTAFFRYRSVWCMCLGWMAYNTVFYGLLTWLPPDSVRLGASGARSFTKIRGPCRNAEVVVQAQAQMSPVAWMEQRRRSELGRQVTIDLEADADFDENRRCPGHDFDSYYGCGCLAKGSFLERIGT